MRKSEKFTRRIRSRKPSQCPWLKISFRQQGTQMAVALSAEKPLEERINKLGRTLAHRRIPYAARRKKRHSWSRNQQKRQLPHFPPFLFNSPDRIKLRHPHHTGTSRSQRCEHHHDLYPCSEPRGWWRGKSARQNVMLRISA